MDMDEKLQLSVSALHCKMSSTLAGNLAKASTCCKKPQKGPLTWQLFVHVTSDNSTALRSRLFNRLTS